MTLHIVTHERIQQNAWLTVTQAVVGLIFPQNRLTSSRHELSRSSLGSVALSGFCRLSVYLTESCFLQTDKSLLVFFIQSLIRFGTVYSL